jgi:hypothetical protein
VPFPGVDNSLSRGQLTIKHTKYYQWVAFTLFFQVSTDAISFIKISRYYFNIDYALNILNWKCLYTTCDLLPYDFHVDFVAAAKLRNHVHITTRFDKPGRKNNFSRLLARERSCLWWNSQFNEFIVLLNGGKYEDRSGVFCTIACLQRRHFE